MSRLVVRRPPKLPTGVVSFLLTDIEDSSGHWEADPEGMAAALELHDELIAGTVDAHAGRLLKTKGEGDATVSVFPRASDAVAAAVGIQEALGGASWPGELELWVRMAVHPGEAHERGGDYFGPALNRAARLRALTRGGATVVSQATAEIVHDRLPREVELVDLGRHELRGLSRPENVFELRPVAAQGARAPGAVAVQPVALEAAAETPDGAFVGRERELAELVGGLADAFAGRGRLFLLVGEPGSARAGLPRSYRAGEGTPGAGAGRRCWEAAAPPPTGPGSSRCGRTCATPTPRTFAHLAGEPPTWPSCFRAPRRPCRSASGGRTRVRGSALPAFDSVTRLPPARAAAAPARARARRPARGGRALASAAAVRRPRARREPPAHRRRVPRRRPRLADPLATTVGELAREPVTERSRSPAWRGRRRPPRRAAAPGAPAAELVAAVHAETEGNPLFVDELMRLLVAEGALDDVARARGRLRASRRGARHDPPPPRPAAAVSGRGAHRGGRGRPRVQAPDPRARSPRGPAALIGQLDEAAEAGLVQELPRRLAATASRTP